MANKVLIKRSSVASKNPATTDLALGELALNTYDGNLFFKKAPGGTESIVQLARSTDILSYSVVTSNTTAVAGQGYLANTTGGTFTITLPASPSTGAYVVIADAGNFTTNNLYIARNGSTIEGVAQDLTADISGVSITLTYDGSTWQVYTQVGATGGSGGGGSGSVTSVATGTGLTGGTITSTGTISIDSTVTTLTGSQTLTNKTLTSPVITSPTITSGGQITGNVTINDSLVGGNYNRSFLNFPVGLGVAIGSTGDGNVYLQTGSAGTVSNTWQFDANGKITFPDSTQQSTAWTGSVPTSILTGTLSIAKGGTGQTTAAAAFNALSPITTTGDLIIGNGTNSTTRLGIGTSGYVLTSNGTTAYWQASGGSSNYSRTSYTATSNQTTFSATYAAGYVQVFVNGVMLNGSDYTATNGTSVVLGVGCTVGDIVEIISWTYTSLNATTNALTIGAGLSGTSFNGSSAVTIAIDSTVATLTGVQTLTNKTLTSPTLTAPALGTPASGNFSSGTFTWPTFNQNTTGSAATLTTPRAINGVNFDGSAPITVKASTTNALTIGTGLSGTSFDGSSTVTIAIDSTVATLTGAQTLTNKSLTSPTVTGTAVIPIINSGTSTALTLQSNGTTAVTVNTSGAVGFGSSPSYGSAGQVLISSGSSNSPVWANNSKVYTVVFLTSSTSWTVPTGVTSVNVLTVAGGGAGTNAGVYGGGGGGGGQVVLTTGYSTTPGGSITATIGAGATIGSGNAGASSFGSITAYGGNLAYSGSSSSGGGSGLGFSGGTGASTSWGECGGGGGGAAGPGANGVLSGWGGQGGVGYCLTLNGITYYFGGGGGGGGARDTASGRGGYGGGGNGGSPTYTGGLYAGNTGSNGVANTGGGGGGGGGGSAGFNGGSGIVIIFY